jgi:hypothetical protein
MSSTHWDAPREKSAGCTPFPDEVIPDGSLLTGQRKPED